MAHSPTLKVTQVVWSLQASEDLARIYPKEELDWAFDESLRGQAWVFNFANGQGKPIGTAVCRLENASDGVKQLHIMMLGSSVNLPWAAKKTEPFLVDLAAKMGASRLVAFTRNEKLGRFFKRFVSMEADITGYTRRVS